jgi:hypothetical protein
MKVGDKITLKEFPTWGICRITHVDAHGGNTTYQVRRWKTPGITRLINLSASQLILREEIK